MGVAMPRLGPEFGLDAGAKGFLFSVNNIGMVLGAAVGGWLADRTGRRPVLMCAVALFGLFTFWVSIAKSYEALVAVRFLAGVGFGAALPNMMAIAAELSSPARRALTASLVFCGLPIGGGSARRRRIAHRSGKPCLAAAARRPRCSWGSPSCPHC
jgi:AAHS family 3-hydroxyphenylpropionic acid transporter